MNQAYYILQADGAREGPYTEEEILDLLESGEIKPGDSCQEAESGRVRPAGRMFHVIAPEPERKSVPAPVPWQPAPFPGEEEKKPVSRPRPKLLYRGSPSALNYWRSVVLAGVVFAGGVLLRQTAADVFLLSQIAGSLILLSAILRLLRTQYFITTARVAMRMGLVIRSSRELRISDIRSIHLERRGMAGILGIGTITFSGAEAEVVFRQVWRAGKWRALVQRLQDTAPVKVLEAEKAGWLKRREP